MYKRNQFQYAFFLALLSCSASAETVQCDKADISDARQFLNTILLKEASGARLRELLGLTHEELFYRNVFGGSTTEPGWDVVEIRPSFSIERMRCSRDDTDTVVVGEVAFSRGWWLSRENYGEEATKTQHYTVIKNQGIYQLRAPLPGPFLSPGAALRFIGSEPYDTARLIEFRRDLTRHLGQSGGHEND